ncbi:MAG: glycosyltransferase family 39 protein [Pseudomonadota bacterium]
MILQKTFHRKAQLSSNFPHSPAGAPGAAAAVAPQPQRWLAFLLLAQLLVWVIFPMLGHHSPPLDVIEMHTWASVPQLGYYKHPPLPAWGIYLSEAFFGRSDLALFLPSALSVALATLAVWPLALRFFGARRALVAMFLQASVAYYHLYAPDFNHNVAQMPVWAMTVTAYYFALAEGGKRWWFAFGAALGATALAKYSAAFLPLACVALLLWDRQARRHVTPTNIVVAAAGFFLLFGPHLWWLIEHDFGPLRYLNERLGDLAQHASWSERFVSYIATQLIVHFVLLGVLLACWRRTPSVDAGAPPAAGQRMDKRFLLALGLGPFLLTLVAGLCGSYLHPMWASAMFPLSGLLVVLALGARAERLATRGWLIAWCAMMLVFGAVYAAKNTAFWHSVSHKYARAAYPGPELARAVEQRWRAAAPGRPLRNIVGTRWEAGVTSFFAADNTRVLIEADFSTSPWLTPEELARCGAMVVWDQQSAHLLPALQRQFARLQPLAPLALDPARAGTFDRQQLSLALILPAPESTPAACPAR